MIGILETHVNTNEGRVYFALAGDDFDPDELTEFIGIQPTTIIRKGSRDPGKIPQTSSWVLSTENMVDDFIDVYEMSRSIVNQLMPKKDLIWEAIERFSLSPRLEVVLWFSINEDISTPVIGFDVETIKFLGEIGADIDIDSYKH